MLCGSYVGVGHGHCAAIDCVTECCQERLLPPFYSFMNLDIGFYTVLVELFYTVRRGGKKKNGRKRKEKGKREKKKRRGAQRASTRSTICFFLKILSEDSCPVTKGRKGSPDDRLAQSLSQSVSLKASHSKRVALSDTLSAPRFQQHAFSDTL